MKTPKQYREYLESIRSLSETEIKYLLSLKAKVDKQLLKPVVKEDQNAATYNRLKENLNNKLTPYCQAWCVGSDILNRL